MNLAMVFFIFLYLSQNFMVNMIDLLVFKNKFDNYYHDNDFLKSFSYKLYQAFIALIFSVLYG